MVDRDTSGAFTSAESTLGKHIAAKRRQSLPVLAKLINKQVSAAKRDGESATRHAMEAGRLLHEAQLKCRVERLTWKDWVAEHLDCSLSYADKLILLHKRTQGLSLEDSQRVASLPIRQAFTAMADELEPKPERVKPKPGILKPDVRSVVQALSKASRGLSRAVKDVQTRGGLDADTQRIVRELVAGIGEAVGSDVVVYDTTEAQDIPFTDALPTTTESADDKARRIIEEIKTIKFRDLTEPGLFAGQLYEESKRFAVVPGLNGPKDYNG